MAEARPANDDQGTKNDQGAAASEGAAADARRPRRDDRLRSASIGVALVAIVAALAWAGFSLAADGGAASPEAAVERLFDALDREDTAGMLAALTPDERDALEAPLDELAEALRDVGVVTADGGDPLDGVEITADAITTRTPATSGASVPVEVVAGRLEVDVWPAIDTRGRNALDLLLGVDVEHGLLRDFSLDPARLTAVSDGDGWYVSVLRSPDASSATGASGPEEAVERFLGALANQDRQAVEALVVPDLGGALIARSSFLFPHHSEGRPDIERDVRVQELDLSSSGDGDERVVRVESLRAELVTEVHRADIDYDGTCFAAVYRWAAGSDPFATFRTCNAEGTRITFDTPSGTVTSPTPDAGEKETDVAAAQDREQQREGQSAQTDSFGQPIENGAEARLEIPTARPADTPFASLANFGGGADFPTFVVVETESGWQIDPVATLARSLVETLRASPDVEELADRVDGLRGNALEAEAIAYESRDPDNLLFGPPAASRLAAACFVEIFPVVGEATALEVYPGCVAELLRSGAIDSSEVPIAALLGRCYGAPPSGPPALDNMFRRLYFADVAVADCVRAAVDEGEVPPEVLAGLPDDERQVCFGPYLELERTDPEDAWAAADAEVEACTRARIPAPG